MTTKGLTLYGSLPTRVGRPLWLLNELNLPCTFVDVDLRAGGQFAAEFTTLNPAGKVPVLTDGTFTITESAAICLYLAERYGGGRFLPENPFDRALMHQWMFFLATEIEQPLWRMALHKFGYDKAERNAGEIELAKRDCRRMISVLDSHLESREFMVGQALSVADFIAAYTLDWAEAEGLLEGAPKAEAYLKKMYARPLAPPRIKEAYAAKSAGRALPRLREFK